MGLLIKLFFLTFLATPLIVFAPKNKKAYLSLALTTLLAIASTWMVVLNYQHGTINHYLSDLSLIGPVQLKIDALSSVFLLVINFTALTSSFFSTSYLKNFNHASPQGLQLFSSVILHASLLLVCMVQDLLAFIVFWEIVSLCSFIQFLSNPEEQVNIKAALNYFIQIHLNAGLLMFAVAWLHSKTGMQEFEAFHFYFQSNDNLPLFLLFFLSFGMSAGFLPLHQGLVRSSASCSSPSAGLLSGVASKLGIYGILRVLTYVENDMLEIGVFIYCISLFTGLYGVLQASVQKEVRKLLTWTAVQNTGIAGMGIGLGIFGMAQDNQLITFLGLAGALLHVINHSLYQSLLFYTSGAVFVQTGTRQLSKLGGLIKKMPVTAALFLIGALSICGVPPFNGFVSEFLIYSGMMSLLHTKFNMNVLEITALISLALIGGFAVFTFARLFGIMFLGNPRSDEASSATEAATGMHIPMVAIVLLMLGIGLAPELFVKFISRAVNLYMPGNLTGIVIHQFDSISGVGLASILLIIMTSGIYFIRTLKVKANTEAYEPAKESGNKNLYTGTSFAEQFSPLAEPVLKIKTKSETLLQSTTQNQSWVALMKRIQQNHANHYWIYASLLVAALLLLTLFDVIR